MTIKFQADADLDPEVLKLAADAGRLLGSADVKTIPVHFAEYIGDRDSPGILLIPSSRPFSSTPEQLRNQALWLPWAGGYD